MLTTRGWYADQHNYMLVRSVGLPGWQTRNIALVGIGVKLSQIAFLR